MSQSEIEYYPAHMNVFSAYYTCSECQCIIPADRLEDHRVTEAKMAELIEWAQAVSKLMPVPVEEEPYDNAFGKEDIKGFQYFADGYDPKNESL